MLGEGLALASSVAWAASVVLFKRSEAISPTGLNLFKNVFALVLLSLTLVVISGNIDWGRSAEDWWRLSVSGIIGIAVADTLFFMALRRLGAGRLAIVECVYAPLIVVLSVIFLGERVGMGFLLGACLVVAGVFVSGRDQSKIDTTTKELLRGSLMGVAGVACMAVGVVVAKPALERGSLVEVTMIRLVAGVAIQLLGVLVMPSAWSVLRVFVPSSVWRTLLPASLLGSYLAMLLWLGGFKWADASVAAVLNQLTTVFTIVLARIYLQEPLTIPRVLGGGVAVAGALIILLW